MANVTERRCKATNRQGDACRATIVQGNGYCVAHDPERPADMRALGKASARARTRQKAERVPESLRARLREQLDPEKVQAAIEQSLAGGNESARVAAVRFLADLELYKEGGEQDRAKEMKQAAADARAYLEAALARQAAAYRAEGNGDLAEALQQAAASLWADGEQAVTTGGVVVRDVTAEQAEAALRSLVEVGLIAPPDMAGELAGLRAEVGRLEQELARIPQEVRAEFVVEPA